MTTRQWTPATQPTPDPIATAGTSQHGGDTPAEPADASPDRSADPADGARNGDSSIAGLVARLADEADHYARAELRFIRALLIERLIAARVGAICLVMALVLLQTALIALIVGLIFAAAPVVGALAATALVTGGTIAIAVILGWIALHRLNRATRIEDRP